MNNSRENERIIVSIESHHARNAEVVRHWKMLLRINTDRSGVSVKQLAQEFGVTQRTVWRDLAALQEVGFPLVDEKRDRTTFWTLMNMPLKALNDAGLSVTEACSLYLSRALLVRSPARRSSPGSPRSRRNRKGLSPKVRAFLKQCPT